MFENATAYLENFYSFSLHRYRLCPNEREGVLGDTRDANPQIDKEQLRILALLRLMEALENENGIAIVDYRWGSHL